MTTAQHERSRTEQENSVHEKSQRRQEREHRQHVNQTQAKRYRQQSAQNRSLEKPAEGDLDEQFRVLQATLHRR